MERRNITSDLTNTHQKVVQRSSSIEHETLHSMRQESMVLKMNFPENNFMQKFCIYINYSALIVRRLVIRLQMNIFDHDPIALLLCL